MLFGRFSVKWVVSAALLSLVAIVVIFSHLASDTPDKDIQSESLAHETLRNAFANLSDEFDLRINTTPLKALSMLTDTLDNGTINVEFSHRNREVLLGGITRGNATILADGRNDTYAIDAVIGLMGGLMNIDLELHINNEGAALRSALAGNTFYGITYSTFEADIQQFAHRARVDEQMVEQMTRWVSNLEKYLNENSDSVLLDAESLSSFLLDFEYEYSIDDDEMSIKIKFNSDDIALVLSKLEAMNSLAYNAFIERFNTHLPSFEYIHELELLFGMLDERLVSASMYLRIETDGVENGLWVHLFICELSRYGEWLLHMQLNEYDYADEHRVVWTNFTTWTISDGLYATEHSISMTTIEEDLTPFWETSSSFETMIRSIWPKGDGNFELSLENNEGEFNLSGMFSLIGEYEFRIQFDDIDLSPTETLNFEIHAVQGGVSISPIEFVNLDHWSPEFLDVINFVIGFIL